MEFENDVLFLEEVSPDQIEVEVETSETSWVDPLLDHNYNLTQPKHKPKFKIRELKAMYHCSKCGYATFNQGLMRAHSLTHKPAPQRCIPCPSCTVSDEFERCTECSYYTKKKTSLKIHMRIHMREKPYKCTECDHREATLKGLIEHYERGHGAFEKVRCHFCNYTSTERKGGLARHLKHCVKIKK